MALEGLDGNVLDDPDAPSYENQAAKESLGDYDNNNSNIEEEEDWDWKGMRKVL